LHTRAVVAAVKDVVMMKLPVEAVV